MAAAGEASRASVATAADATAAAAAALLGFLVVLHVVRVVAHAHERLPLEEQRVVLERGDEVLLVAVLAAPTVRRRGGGGGGLETEGGARARVVQALDDGVKVHGVRAVHRAKVEAERVRGVLQRGGGGRMGRLGEEAPRGARLLLVLLPVGEVAVLAGGDVELALLLGIGHQAR